PTHRLLQRRAALWPPARLGHLEPHGGCDAAGALFRRRGARPHGASHGRAPMSRTLNVAVVGLGIGKAHIAEGYVKHPDKFRVLALCDLDAKRLASVADEFGVPSRTASFEEVLGMAEIDVVDLCTPPTLHVPQTLAAIAAEKHVVCEKPLAGSLADVDRLIEAQRTAKSRIMPVFQYRFGNGLQKAKRIVDLGL